jgi:hypothetical protein
MQQGSGCTSTCITNALLRSDDKIHKLTHEGGQHAGPEGACDALEQLQLPSTLQQVGLQIIIVPRRAFLPEN